jgi:hypothetical protein
MSRAQLRRHLRTIALAFTFATSASAATPERLALNTPTCAQQTENFRLTCRRECEESRFKGPMCLKDCDSHDKLLEYLKKCEERMKPSG